MKKRMTTSAALAASLMMAAPSAGAQEISPVFNMGLLTGTASLGVVIKKEQARAAREGASMAPSAPAPAPGHAFTRPAPAAAAALPMGYSAPALVRRQALAEFVERVRRRSPQNASIIQQQFAQHDYHGVYDGIVRPYGLAGDDAANALAAYLLLGWMIVHEGQEPSAAAVRGVRAQAAAALSESRLTAPEARARVGEEFKILFVTVHAGWQSAQREGARDRYATGVADMFRNADGIDLRALRLSPAGFERG